MGSFQSKYDGKCKAGCGRTWKAGDTIHGLGSHFCTDANCKMEGGGATAPAPAPAAAAPPAATQMSGVPELPNQVANSVHQYTLKILGIRQAVIQAVQPYDANPNPAMIGQMVHLIWDQLKEEGAA